MMVFRPFFTFPSLFRLVRGLAGVALFLLLASTAQASGGKDSPLPVGMHTFGIWNPATEERIDAAVWYPARGPGRTVHRFGWVVPFGSPRPIAEGFYPVILLSHDTASSRFANNDLAIALASSGFIVIAPTHAGDNINDCSRIYSAELLFERPQQLLRTLETVLASNEFAPYVDESRIGLLGVGFGAITVAQLTGMEPATHLLPQICSGPAANDFFCSTWSAEKLKSTAPVMEALKEKYGRNAFTPNIVAFAPQLEPAPPAPAEPEKTREAPAPPEREHSALETLAAFFGFAHEDPPSPSKPESPPEETPAPAVQAEFVYLLDFQGGDLFGGTNSGARFVELEASDAPLMRFIVEKVQPQPETPVDRGRKFGKQPHLRPASTRSIKAVAFLAPAGGLLFSALETQATVPSVIVAAVHDEFYPYPMHGRQYESIFPQYSAPLLLRNVDHYSLFAPCDAEMQSSPSGMCGRLTGEYRKKTQELRDNLLVPFFRKTLGAPGPVPPPSGLVASPSARADEAAPVKQKK
jgi:Predicted dienelactone hydrolase